MVKTKIISNGKLDIEGAKKIGKSLLITIAAAVIGWIGNSTGIIDYGSTSTLIGTMLPFVVATLYKILAKYEVKA